MMNDTTMIKANLVSLLPDDALRKRISSELSGDYSVSNYADLESFYSSEINDSSPQLILCHHQFVDKQNGEELINLCQKFPQSRVLIIGPALPVSIQIDALKHGARGYFNEELPVEKLEEAMQLLLRGEVWVERHVISGLIDELNHKPSLSPEQQQALDSLSPKELEVAKLVSHGATNKMIARSMDITERTVKAHLTTIFHKLNLPDRLSLAIFFRDLR